MHWETTAPTVTLSSQRSLYCGGLDPCPASPRCACTSFCLCNMPGAQCQDRGQESQCTLMDTCTGAAAWYYRYPVKTAFCSPAGGQCWGTTYTSNRCVSTRELNATKYRWDQQVWQQDVQRDRKTSANLLLENRSSLTGTLDLNRRQRCAHS